jgi:predicted ABC-type ATPase
VPRVVVIAGPNGAAKSTTAPALLRDTLGITAFVNADEIARGLSAFDVERVALQAGRIMLRRLHELADEGADFAFETTLASRIFAGFLQEIRPRGYEADLLYLWLPSPDLAVGRVRERVRLGGQHIPEDDIRHRYHRSLRNVFHLYRPVLDRWRMYDNHDSAATRLIAFGGADAETVIDAATWAAITQQYRDGNAAG